MQQGISLIRGGRVGSWVARLLVLGLLLPLLVVLGRAALPDKKPAEGSFAGQYRQVTFAFASETSAIAKKREELAGDPAKNLQIFESLLVATRQARGSYESLDPPAPGVRAPLAQLVTLMSDQEQALRTIISAINSDDTQGASVGLQSYAKSVDQWLKARESMDRAIASCGKACL